MDLLIGAGFTDIKITIKDNAKDIIKDWMPGSGAENYVTSCSVTANKPMDADKHIKDDVRVGAACCTTATDCCAPPSNGCAPKENGCAPKDSGCCAPPAPVEKPVEPEPCKPQVTGC